MKQATTVKAKKQVKNVSTAAKTATVESVSKEKTAIKIEQALNEIAAEQAENVKEAETKAVEKKATAKKNVVVKNEVEKVETEKKETKAEVKTEVFFQYYNNEINMDAVYAKVKQAYISEGNIAKDNDVYRIYIKPEENMVYYVVNDSYASGVVLY